MFIYLILCIVICILFSALEIRERKMMKEKASIATRKLQKKSSKKKQKNKSSARVTESVEEKVWKLKNQHIGRLIILRILNIVLIIFSKKETSEKLWIHRIKYKKVAVIAILLQIVLKLLNMLVTLQPDDFHIYVIISLVTFSN